VLVVLPFQPTFIFDQRSRDQSEAVPEETVLQTQTQTFLLQREKDKQKAKTPASEKRFPLRINRVPAFSPRYRLQKKTGTQQRSAEAKNWGEQRGETDE